MVVSWLLRGLELWLMGIGKHDLFLGGEDFESAAKHVWRYKHYYQDLQRRFPKWHLPDSGQILHKGGKQLEVFTLANGSSSTAVNSQTKGVQGDGVAMVVMEEIHTYRDPEAMFGQAKIVTQGSAGSVGGCQVLVANTEHNNGWLQIKKVDEESVKHDDVLPGYQKWTLSSGDTLLKIEYFADPAKDAEWIEAVRKEMRRTPKTFNREILMDESVHEGTPVYLVFDKTRHKSKGLTLRPDSTVWTGWDCGTTRIPALVVLQHWLEGSRLRVQAIKEVVSYGGESMEVFAPRASEELRKHFGEEGFRRIIAGRHYADETVATASGAVEISSQAVARAKGWNLNPTTNDPDARLSAVEWLLTLWVNGEGSFEVDEDNCPVLCAGFEGAYKLKSRGASGGPGIVQMAPEKNIYSHIHDSLQYPSIMLRELFASIAKSSHRDAIETVKRLAARS